jgi:hypothetical protein
MMMQKYIAPYLDAALARVGVELRGEVAFGVPRQEGHGHLSTNVAMMYAKGLGKQPRVFAQELVDALGTVPMVSAIEIAGPGFINITFDNSVYHAMLRDMDAMGDSIGRSTVGSGKSVNVEYVSANPTGPLHAGHGRNCAVGDTIANLFAWNGYAVTREYSSTMRATRCRSSPRAYMLACSIVSAHPTIHSQRMDITVNTFMKSRTTLLHSIVQTLRVLRKMKHEPSVRSRGNFGVSARSSARCLH